MKSYSLRGFLTAFALFICMRSAGAGDVQLPEGLRLSGYGTLGYVQDDRTDIVAIRDISQRPNSNMGRGSFQRDSRIGVQGEYRISPTLDLVGQAVFRDQVTKDIPNSFELAYAGFKPTPHLDVRVGRLGYDAFLMADIRNVGYTYPWVRPFTEFYGWIPMFSVDGGDIAYSIQENKTRWRLKAQAGHSRTGLPVGDSKLNFKTDDLFNLTVSRRSGPWEAKLGYTSFTSKHEAEFGGAGGGLAGLQQGLVTIAAATTSLSPAISSEAEYLRRHLSFNNARVRYLTLGASFDDGHWLIQCEVARTQSNHKIVPHGTMGYVVTAYRTGDWMPFAAISASRPGNALHSASSDWGSVGQAGVQAAAIAALNSTRIDQTTLSLGTRWDFQTRWAAKLQWDHVRISPHGYGLLFKDATLEPSRSRMNQLSLTLDFLF